MANIKSAIKRNKQNEKRRVRNRVFRGRTRTFVQKARIAIDASQANSKVDNSGKVKETVLLAISALDKASGKGIIHKNNAARRKSRLMKKYSLSLKS